MSKRVRLIPPERIIRIIVLSGPSGPCDDGVGFSARLEQELSTMKIGRSAKTGQFVPVREAQRKSSTHVVETIKPSPKPKK